MRVSELQGAELDYWVARAEDFLEPEITDIGDGITKICAFHNIEGDEFYFSPSEAWEDGGPIIEREKIGLDPFGPNLGGYEAYIRNADNSDDVICCVGKTPLEAAMRCYVASKFGEAVDAGN